MVDSIFVALFTMELILRIYLDSWTLLGPQISGLHCLPMLV